MTETSDEGKMLELAKRMRAVRSKAVERSTIGTNTSPSTSLAAQMRDTDVLGLEKRAAVEEPRPRIAPESVVPSLAAERDPLQQLDAKRSSPDTTYIWSAAPVPIAAPLPMAAPLVMPFQSIPSSSVDTATQQPKNIGEHSTDVGYGSAGRTPEGDAAQPIPPPVTDAPLPRLALEPLIAEPKSNGSAKDTVHKIIETAKEKARWAAIQLQPAITVVKAEAGRLYDDAKVAGREAAEWTTNAMHAASITLKETTKFAIRGGQEAAQWIVQKAEVVRPLVKDSALRLYDDVKVAGQEGKEAARWTAEKAKYARWVVEDSARKLAGKGIHVKFTEPIAATASVVDQPIADTSSVIAESTEASTAVTESAAPVYEPRTIHEPLGPAYEPDKVGVYHITETTKTASDVPVPDPLAVWRPAR
jgi:hypothetical protein